MKALASLTLAAAACTLSVPALAQFAKPEDAVKYRQSSLSVMATHFGRIGAMVQGRVPFDAKAAADNAELVATLSKLPWAGFAPGADSPKAKAEIWSNAAKFKEESDKLQVETGKLLAAAKTGNLDALKTAFGATGGACKSCHDDFRAK